MSLHLGEQGRVIGGVDDDRDIGMIFRRGADHGGAADVDILNAIVVVRAFGDGRFERIEIDHQQIDRFDAVRLHGARMIGVAANAQEPAMHLGVKRFDAAVHHLGEAGDRGDIGGLDSGLGQHLCCSARGNDFDPESRECAGEFEQSGLVRH